jgi:thymidylate synthase
MGNKPIFKAMLCKEFKGINSFLIGISKYLLSNGVERKTRGFTCYELPYPIICKISNPLSRLVTITERNWNYILPYVESLWLASGRNDMKLIGHYVSKMYDFSDDGKTMRGGYGPRLRFFNGISEDYDTGFLQKQNKPIGKNLIEIDQYEFLNKVFLRDPHTRQGIISIPDPAKDCFGSDHNLRRTKDFPCTSSLHFQRNGNKLDLIVHMRSNDLVWGATGVNIFNFTFIQEYFTQILGLEIGAYYHIVDNLHYYENFREMLEQIAEINNAIDESYNYRKSFNSLSEFDEKLKLLQFYERDLREKKKLEQMDFGDEFFNDWANVLLSFYQKKAPISFANPILAELSKRKLAKRIIEQIKK